VENPKVGNINDIWVAVNVRPARASAPEPLNEFRGSSMKRGAISLRATYRVSAKMSAASDQTCPHAPPCREDCSRRYLCVQRLSDVVILQSRPLRPFMLHEMCDYVCHGASPPECQGSWVGGFRSGQVIYCFYWSLIILRVDRPGFFSVPRQSK
jgi:hypothetical protein